VTTAEKVRRNLGLRIVEMRRASGTTQEELAVLLAMDARDLRRIEAGESNVTVDTLVRIAEALGVPVAALFDVPSAGARRDPGRPAHVTTKKRPRRSGPS
jgi:transcriptional regulator with XRE-family HTH domain